MESIFFKGREWFSDKKQYTTNKSTESKCYWVQEVDNSRETLKIYYSNPEKPTENYILSRYKHELDVGIKNGNFVIIEEKVAKDLISSWKK